MVSWLGLFQNPAFRNNPGTEPEYIVQGGKDN
jgi:hypothetical protein